MNYIIKKSGEFSKKEILEIITKNSVPWDKNFKLIDNDVIKDKEVIWDLAGIGKGNRIVFIAVVTTFNNQILFDIIKKIDWTIENIELVLKSYVNFNINSEISPRFILISPSFSRIFKKIISGLNNYEIDLFSYKCLEYKEGKGILLEDINAAKGQNDQNTSELNPSSSESLLEFTNLTDEEIEEFYK